MKEKWDLATAIAMIKRNGGRVTKNKVSHPKPGLKVLGAIDYLVNYHKFNFIGGK